MAEKAQTRRPATKKTTRKAAKRELIGTGTDKRYVRRGAAGRFKESDDVGTSLAADRRTKAKTTRSAGKATRATARPQIVPSVSTGVPVPPLRSLTVRSTTSARGARATRQPH